MIVIAISFTWKISKLSLNRITRKEKPRTANMIIRAVIKDLI